MTRYNRAATVAGGLSTRAVHAGVPERAPGQPVVSPVVPSATFFNEPVPTGAVQYTRYGNNPNHRILAGKIAALEGAEDALVVGSGMAATALAMLALCEPGSRVAAPRTLYGQTLHLMTAELNRFGIATRLMDDDEDWDHAVPDDASVLFVEAVSNPTLRVPDLRDLARLAARRGAQLVVDATFATPVNVRPIERGADVVIHSATKYLGGHSDLIAGTVAGPVDFIARVREKLKNFGPSLDPHAAWLLERGMKTLALRVERQNANAAALAAWLGEHPAVERVIYPGLDSHPDHRVAAAILDGFGGMLAFVVRGGDEAAVRVLGRLRLCCVAPSLGGVETLVSMPRYTSHTGLSPGQRRAIGIDDGFIRVSVGIEDVADLQTDLAEALDAEV